MGRSKFLVLFAVSTFVLLASPAHAQWGDVKISLARVDFDLSGTGNAPGLTVRTTRHLTDNVNLEIGGLFAKPDQQFGPSTLFAPEAHLQYHWTAGRFFPYAGGGLGAAMVKSDFHTDWDPTWSGAAGTLVRVTDRFGINGEFRLRLHEWDAAGTTTEFSVGGAWRWGAF